MATLLSFPHFTPTLILSLLLLLSSTTVSINLTTILSSYPELSDFCNLLTTSFVDVDLNDRSSVTVLAVPNSYLRSFSTSDDLAHRSSAASLADILRYHILLQYFSLFDLSNIPLEGKLVTTLYQATGRATNNFGSVNITRQPVTNYVFVQSPIPISPSNATVLDLITTLPYNVSVFTVNALIVPYGLDLMASDFRPPLGLNITKALLDGHDFNVAAAMLSASGVIEEFEADERGAGITLFVPIDSAFANLPAERLQSLSADKKAVILKFHVLHSYYPLGSLQSIVNPVQPTLATEEMGAGRFTLNISRFNGSVAINTGLVEGYVTQTVFDQNPVSIFGVSKVLLPKEMFEESSTTIITAAPPSEITYPPANSSELDGPSPSHSTEESRSGAGGINEIWRFILSLSCIALYLVV